MPSEQIEWQTGWAMEKKCYKGQVEWRAGWAMEEYMKDRLSYNGKNIYEGQVELMEKMCMKDRLS